MSLNTFNLSKPFQPCPTTNNLPLPFEIDEMAFSVWFNSLAIADDMTKCKQIFQVLQTLNNAYPPERNLIPGRTRLFFLEKMGSALTKSTTKLTYLPSIPESSSDGTETVDEIPKSEISVWSSLELAKAFSFLSQEEWFKDYRYYSVQEKSLILSNGINAMGRGLLYTSQVYSKPYIYFWHNCFEFYRLAQHYRLTESEFNPDAKNIDNAFKRVLVFAISNTNQFTPSEMRSIYELLGHYAAYTGLLQSIPKKKFNGIPSIHLNGNEPPAISDEKPDTHDPDRLYIATVTVASKILEATYDKRAHHVPTDRLMLLRLARTLTLNDQRKNPRETVDGNHFGIMGFDNIANFLRSKEIEQQNYLAKTGHFDPSRPGELRDLDFEITLTKGKQANEVLPPSAFQVVEFTDTTEIWKASSQDPHETNVHMIDKSTKGYGLLWTDNIIKPKVGRIIGVMHRNLTIGLIRWLAQSKETGMFMGVEIMGNNATTVKVYNPGYPDIMVYAIFLSGNEASRLPSSLIIMNKDFHPSEFIFIQKNMRNIRYRLTKQLHLTSFINHVEVVRSH
jgi:hypothetical protein